MKSEIRYNAFTAAENVIKEALQNRIVPVRVNDKDSWAMETGHTDENGVPIYALLSLSIAATSDTKRSRAFNFGEAVQERVDHDAAPKRERAVKEVDPETEARRTKRNDDKNIVRDWCEVNLTSEPMTTTEIYNALPEELRSYMLMQIGGMLKEIAAEEGTTLKRETVKSKAYYSKKGVEAEEEGE